MSEPCEPQLKRCAMCGEDVEISTWHKETGTCTLCFLADDSDESEDRANDYD